MTDRPIIFSAPMVRALLEGRKTQTRRLMKIQPPTKERFPHSVFGLSPSLADGVKVYSQNNYAQAPKHPTDFDLLGCVGVARNAGFPLRYRMPFAVGDRLWVRENWCPRVKDGALVPGAVLYAADGGHVVKSDGDGFTILRADGREASPWRPSIHMPRWASRLTLTVQSMKAEQLQSIIRSDARAEGVEPNPVQVGTWMDYSTGPSSAGWSDPRQSFQSLWNSLHGADAWEANPWVIALTFTVQRQNIDAEATHG